MDLYGSPLFVKSRAFVEQHCDSWFVLSAKHGLVKPTDVIEPYEETLNTKSADERRNWSDGVWSALRVHLKPNDRVTILAGKKYRNDLLPLIKEYGCRIDVPMVGLGIGRQLQWLTQRLQRSSREQNIERFYEAP
jgi:hypothetical protein